MGFWARLFGKENDAPGGTGGAPAVSVEQVGTTLLKTTTHHDGRVSLVAKHIPTAVDGSPTYELAETHKNDLKMMLRCCEAAMNRYKASGEPPALFLSGGLPSSQRRTKTSPLK
jgi:hypothetical protein